MVINITITIIILHWILTLPYLANAMLQYCKGTRSAIDIHNLYNTSRLLKKKEMRLLCLLESHDKSISSHIWLHMGGTTCGHLKISPSN